MIIIIDAWQLLRERMALVANLRQRFPMLGIVVLAGMRDEASHARVLHDGADYFLYKPIKDSVLLATIRSFMRRLSILTDAVVNTDESWRLHRRNCMLGGPSGERISLSDRECAVLTTLFLSPNVPVSSERLLQALNMATDLFDPHRIDTIIYRIRKKLRQARQGGLEIRNVYGKGYICIGSEESAVFYVWDG
ncbi:response regulator transcription factor [Herbaspirillum sp. alder98]|uniref:response regulator transcription factor n=1 Tax=Herbaspirillum sp. alder98 TaxID=2913096 RepID=UPI001CD8AC01|nr:winged helix-turn-helix domain-containing protein [Herbaspirillum sp. alder98]MCA1326878.1 winged helix-turn-helix domain-containing protein [Herbaspirillum sp. alder98]